MTDAATEEIIQQHTQAIEDVTLSVASLTQALQSEAKRATESDDLQSGRTKSAEEKADAAEAAANDAKDSVSTHEARKDNPHGVTAEQLSLATVATSGKYEDLTGTPTIPTALTDLTNATTGGYITSNQAYVSESKTLKFWHDHDFPLSTISLPHGQGKSTALALQIFDATSLVDILAIIDAVFALKDEPVFTAWRDGSCVKAGKDATVAENDADGASVVNATALGANSYTATSGSLAVAQTPDAILLNSKKDDSGASAKTLQAYLDEKADATDLSTLSNTVSALSAKVDSANAALEEVV